MEEIWRNIEGFEGYYQVSNKGRVKSIDRTIIDSRGVSYLKKGKVLKQRLRNDGYYQVTLSKGSVRKSYNVARLVYSAFNGSIPCGFDVNHIDCNPKNNCLDNLNLMTRKDNCNWGEHNKKISENHKKRVAQYSVDGDIIKIYNSTVSAAYENGFSQGNISRCCNGKLKTANGYVWRFVS